MNYLDIFKKSFLSTWKNKILWIFGFFVLIGSASNGLLLDWKESVNFIKNKIPENLFENGFFLVILFLLFLIIFLLLTAIKILGQASLIGFAGNINSGKKAEFSTLFKNGRARLRKLIFLEILYILFLSALLATLSIPIIFLILAKSDILAFVIGLSAMLIFLPAWLVVHFIKKFSYIHIVLSDISIKDSIEYSHLTFKKNISKTLLFSVLLIVGGTLLGMSLLTIIFMLGIPLFIFGLAVSLVVSSSILYFLIGIIASLFVLMVFTTNSFFEAFRQISWVLFFQELAGAKMETEKEVADEVPDRVATPESA